MRRSNRGSTVAAFALVVGLVAACGPGGSGTVSPSPQPTPLITPDPHLQEPASVDDVYQELAKAGLRITANTATIGTDGVTVKRINATYASWPLVLTEFKSTSARRVAGRFDSGRPPRQGESPYMIAGMNILLEFGPHSTNDKTPAPPESAHVSAALDLVRALHPLLGPLEQRSTQPLPLPTPVPTPAPPSASPRPTS
jgi:hypothetical protein